ncbi:MAG: XRE family transcriptional regulator [Clostridiaceae bacterium]|nr:XRE family transcriptional regulator [Clostridiaceae bacterium]
MYNEQRFRDFIVEAKRATYAGYGKETESSRIKSRDLPYEKGDLKYLDSYLGESQFIGEEVVWYNDEPIWGMNYYGTLIDEPFEGFGDFLKSALRLVTPEAPYRGPKYFCKDEMEYICSWEGDITFFEGREEIRFKGKPVYRLVFHGGKIRELSSRI